MRGGDSEHAVIEYHAFLAEALHRIGNGMADAGDFEAGSRLFDEALQLSPGDLSIEFDYAKACLDVDQLQKAKSLAGSVANANPTPEAALLFGRVLFHLGEFDAARVQIERAFASRPEFDSGFLLGKIYLLLHREKEAHALFDGMAANFGDTARTHLYLARAYSETDHGADAIEEFHRAMAKDDRAPDVHYYLGIAYLGHNEAAGYEKAVPEFRAELERNSNDFRSRYMLGYIALKQRNFVEAESDLLAALAIQPADIQSQLQLAEVYTDTNRLKEAETQLRQALSFAKDSPANEGQSSRANYLLGRLLDKTGRHEEAAREMLIVADLQRRIGPSSTQTADARTKEAQDEERKAQSGVDPEKRKQLDRFVNALRPAIADAYNGLGVISAGRRDFVSAVKYFRNAGDWDASIEGLDRNLGRAAFFAEQWGQATPPLQRYLQQHPEDNLIRSQIALAWFHLAEYQKVVDVLAPIVLAIQSNPELSSAYTTSLSRIKKK